MLRLREGSAAIPRHDLVPILGLGAVGFGVYQVLWATALRSIPAGDSALIIASTPVLTALFSVPAGADVLTRSKLAGALVSFLGVAVVIAAGPGLSFGAAGLGDLLTLVAAVCWAVYTSWGAPVLRRHSPLRVTAWAMLGGSLVLAPIGILQAVGASWGRVGVDAWAGLLYSSLIPAGLSNVLVFNGIRLLGPTRITAYQFLVPFIAVVMGAVFLSEGIRAEQILGGAVIVLGVAITRAGGRDGPLARALARLAP